MDYKIILSFGIPILLVVINYLIGVKVLKNIMKYEIPVLIKKIAIITFIRTIVLAGLSLLFYKINIINPTPYFITLFVCFFVFKLLEILRINKASAPAPFGRQG